jgi:hypothetical protein
MKVFIKIGCLILILLSLASCYKYKEDNPLAVPPMFQKDYEELTKKDKL